MIFRLFRLGPLGRAIGCAHTGIYWTSLGIRPR